MFIFIILTIICCLLQSMSFIPCYLEWKKDCNNIGKDKLAVSLHERFFASIIMFPFWLIPIFTFFIIFC